MYTYMRVCVILFGFRQCTGASVTYFSQSTHAIWTIDRPFMSLPHDLCCTNARTHPIHTRTLHSRATHTHTVM